MIDKQWPTSKQTRTSKNAVLLTMDLAWAWAVFPDQCCGTTIFTQESEATGNVAAEYGHLLPGNLTPTRIVPHHSYDWRLDGHTDRDTQKYRESTAEVFNC